MKFLQVEALGHIRGAMKKLHNIANAYFESVSAVEIKIHIYLIQAPPDVLRTVSADAYARQAKLAEKILEEDEEFQQFPDDPAALVRICEYFHILFFLIKGSLEKK